MNRKFSAAFAFVAALCLDMLTRSAFADDLPIGPCGGDLGSAFPNCIVLKLNGNALPTFGGTPGYLQWTGSALTLGSPSGTFTAGTDLSGTSTSQTVIQISGAAPVNVVNGALSFGSNSASAGALRLPNNVQFRARNNANTADETIAYVDTAGELQLGDSSQVTNIIGNVQSAASFYLAVAGVNTWRLASGLFSMENPSIAYTFSQGPLTTVSGTGHALTFHCGQDETGTGTTIGGDCILTSGSGATNGRMRLGTGGADRLILSTTGFVDMTAYGTGIAHFDSGGNITSTTVNLASPTDVGTSIAGVSNGGTGQSSITANSVVVGNGTSAVTLESGSSTGQYLRWNASGPPTFQSGPTWSTLTYCASGCTGTSGATFTCPTSGQLFVCGCGGGGGGAAGGVGANGVQNGASGGGGGGGGSVSRCAPVTCTSGATETVTLGAGGTGSSSSLSNGGNGGNTTISESTLGTIAQWNGAMGGVVGFSEVSGTSVLVYAPGGAPVIWTSAGTLGQVNSTMMALSPGQGGFGGYAGPTSSTGTASTLTALAGAGNVFSFASSLFGALAPNGGQGGGLGTASGLFVGGSGGGGGGGGAFGGSGGTGGAGGNASNAGTGVTGSNGGAGTGYGAGGGGGGGGGAGSTGGGNGGAGGNGTPGAVLVSLPQ